MSFSADWLSLREPADHAARAPGLLQAVGRHFAAREKLAIVDLGCGTGSNLRGTAAALPARQHWRLVDHDPALLAAARTRLAAWADTAQDDAAALELTKAGKSLRVTFAQADLAGDLGAIIGADADLVTAAALFDLVSADWIERFVALLAAKCLPLYTVLTYDGSEHWTPPHPADAAMLAAFHAHQGTDKGFGPAAGPAACGLIAAAFAQAGYRVEQAASPWRIGPDMAALAAELTTGFAGAVAETGRLAPATVADWLAARRQGVACTVGHRDLFAHPG
ncbi:hypothetical protein BN1110_05464 [bacterium YEK0313]|nr:hypothetical protein BN1110_05464 [bacterium YEK0313]